ncbi:F-box/LRR-repeat protein At3g59250-like [Pistacia vera]|uniref:F-box/LRR-repeat protein At3g59250-like n=1 Tax=Pistacia vera TaxID=55513 RepID=UPI001262CB2C|nr:F-box/LRR-repeat protein At3g59250-like [Pistacia vera]
MGDICTSERQDRIGELPDDILLHILYFLSIGDVFRTSALSTRWKHLCTLKYTWITTSQLQPWISAAIRCNLQELENSIGNVPLPDNAFTVKSLTVMKLKITSFFQVPSFIKLSNLKTLHLSLFLKNGKGIAEQLEQLFSDCCLLQELVLNIGISLSIKRIKICIPSLRTMVIRCPSNRRILCGCGITIYAENLKVLLSINCLNIEILPCDLSSLNYAYIEDDSDSFTQQTAQNALKLMTGICNVKSLTLSGDILKHLFFEENLQDGLPLFHRLTHLKVIPRKLGYTDYLVWKDILQKSPNIVSSRMTGY